MTNTITKDQAVQLAREAGVIREYGGFSLVTWQEGQDRALAFAQAAYKLGRNAWLEEAKQACVATHSKRSKEGLKTGYNAIMQCSDAIESLKEPT